MKMDLFRTRPIASTASSTSSASSESQPSELNPCLNALDLILLGIGAVVGAGIFVLTGVAAATQAGPGIVISFIFSGLACAFAALSYAELASSIGGAGSAYTYGYASLGELIAWIIGWDLLLEYGVGVCAVAIGWSGYFNNALTAIGFTIPDILLKAPGEGGIVNLPAMLIIWLLSGIIALGVRQSARFNALIVSIKLFAIALFVFVAIPNVNPDNWHPFLPFGWTGVFGGAALVFFAYIGFDAVSTAAEETINPQRNLSIGIIGSLVICSLIYILVSGLLTGIASYKTLNVKSPVAETILHLGYHFAAGVVALGAIMGITSVILIFIFGLTRVFYAISRDGLLPAFFAKVNPTTKTPLRIIFLSTIVMSLGAGFFSIQTVAELVNIGTLAAFVIVCVGVVVLRYKKPDMKRPFKAPFSPVLPILGAIFCLTLMIHLPLVTWIRFVVWLILGLIIYFSYGYRHSRLQKEKT